MRQGIRGKTLARLGLFLACGTLIAAPQIVELLRILGSSYRGHLGYSSGARMAASWDPRQIAEWLLPFAFGRPDRLGAAGFWGHHFFTGHPPYYFSLYPAAGVGPRGRGAPRPLRPLAARGRPGRPLPGAGAFTRRWLDLRVGGGLCDIRSGCGFWSRSAVRARRVGFERCFFFEKRPRRRGGPCT